MAGFRNILGQIWNSEKIRISQGKDFQLWQPWFIPYKLGSSYPVMDADWGRILEKCFQSHSWKRGNSIDESNNQIWGRGELEEMAQMKIWDWVLQPVFPNILLFLNINNFGPWKKYTQDSQTKSNLHISFRQNQIHTLYQFLMVDPV